jgi:hypothetical protein
VHKIPGVPPVFTSIQLIITINVLTARSKNIGLAKVPLKTVLSVFKRTFICNEYVLYYAMRSTSIILGDDY